MSQTRCTCLARYLVLITRYTYEKFPVSNFIDLDLSVCNIRYVVVYLMKNHARLDKVRYQLPCLNSLIFSNTKTFSIWPN